MLQTRLTVLYASTYKLLLRNEEATITSNKRSATTVISHSPTKLRGMAVS
jgi:hypothetical protein